MILKVNEKITTKEGYLVKDSPVDINISSQFFHKNIWLISYFHDNKNDERESVDFFTIRKVHCILKGYISIGEYCIDCTVVQILYDNSLSYIIVDYAMLSNHPNPPCYIIENMDSDTMVKDAYSFKLFDYDEIQIREDYKGLSVYECAKYLFENRGYCDDFSLYRSENLKSVQKDFKG
jgi:hypothetical protein